MTKNTPRIFISLLLMLLCIGILPVSAFASGGDYPDDALPTAESSAADAQETKQIGTVTTNGGSLNVRTGAGLDNTAFTQLPNGTVVDVIGRDGDWVKILLPARVGYVYGGYLTVTDAADSTVSIGGITLPFDEKELADLFLDAHICNDVVDALIGHFFHRLLDRRFRRRIDGGFIGGVVFRAAGGEKRAEQREYQKKRNTFFRGGCPFSRGRRGVGLGVL